MRRKTATGNLAITSRRRRVAYRILVVALVGLLTEIMSCLAIALAPRWLGWEILRTPEMFDRQSTLIERTLAQRAEALTVFDPRLGWRLRPNSRTSFDQINAQGIRSDKEYSKVAKYNTTRIAVFGDSFVYCTEVSDENAWPALIEASFPHLEVLNYGVPAYGPDQAYLRFHDEAADLSPAVVIMGISPVSLDRSVSVYRSFITHWQSTAFATKPRFVLGSDNELILMPNPLAAVADARKYLGQPAAINDLGKYDYWYEPAIFANPLYDYSMTVRMLTHLWIKVKTRYLDPDRPLVGPAKRGAFNQRCTAFKIVTKLVEAFIAECKRFGAAPVVVMLPDRYSLQRSLRGVVTPYAPMVEWCEQHGLCCLDAANAFPPGDAAQLNDWFMPGSHYSPAGNRFIAAWLGQQLTGLASKLSKE